MPYLADVARLVYQLDGSRHAVSLRYAVRLRRADERRRADQRRRADEREIGSGGPVKGALPVRLRKLAIDGEKTLQGVADLAYQQSLRNS
jgi:hypothetical protein